MAVTSRVRYEYALVAACRGLRLANGIAPGRQVSCHIKAASPDIERFLLAQKDSVASLLNAESLPVGTEDSHCGDGSPAPSALENAGAIFLPLQGLVNPEEEKAKLEKQKAELAGWIRGAEAKLSNPRFVEKAPAKVVDDVRAQLAGLQEKLARVEQSLAALK